VRLDSALRLTRAQGLALEALTGLALGGALVRELGWSPTVALAGGLLGACVGWLRWSRARAVRAVEARHPEARHALAAWVEGSGGVLRAHLERWLQARLGAPVLWWPAARAALAGLAWALAAAPAAPALPPARADARPPATLSVLVHVEPPAYAGLPAFDAEGPTVEVLRGSHLTLTWASDAPALLVSEAGGPELPLPVTQGRAVQAFTLSTSRTLRASLPRGSARVVLELKARPDAPPAVELVSPLEDLLVTSAPAAFALRATATDDLGLAGASLHYALAQGDGEAMRFRTGRLPAVTRTQGAALTVEGRVQPLALGMAVGDTLVLWAEATDTNALEGPSVARSGARLLRWEAPVSQLGGGSGAPPPPPSSLLTQRELLARTERLVRGGARGQALDRGSVELARDQRDLRLSFGQLLAADTGDALALDVDEKEVAESTDVKARAWLAKAVSAMWDSERELSIARPAASLPAQRAAVAALDAAFALVRLALRPLAQPDKPVDEGRRLSGDATGLAPRALAATWTPPPEPSLVPLALGLLGAAARGLDAAEARALGDALWALPGDAGVPSAELAAALYAAQGPVARAGAARLAGEALARRALPARLALPPVDAEGARLLARVPLSARP
jgi:hypothetical protein